MQKQAVETFTSATEQMKKNMMGNNMIDSDFFKKWYDSQMAFFNNTTAGADSNPVSFINTWMNNQVKMAGEWMEAVQNNYKNAMGNAAGFNMNEEAKKSYSQMLSLYNSWMSTMTNTYSEMAKNFSNGNMTTKEAFAGMFNNAEMYMKSFEFWMPMLKSIQDKTFTPDMFKQLFNAPLFKETMDKMFNLQPDFMKDMFSSNMNTLKDNMGRMMDMNKNMFDSMKNSMNAGMPNVNEMFTSMRSNYTGMHDMFRQAAAPLMKLVSPGKSKEQMEALNAIADEMSLFSINNAKMQYMMYATGMKAMEEVAENIYGRIRNGEEISNFMNIYSEWLNTSDKHFVSLFSSEEYSKMQGEVHSLGMKLKRHVDLQMENALGNVPVIVRSEMDELYKTIQELKKRINTLEKQIDGEGELAAEEKEAKPARRSSAKNA